MKHARDLGASQNWWEFENLPFAILEDIRLYMRGTELGLKQAQRGA